MTHQLHHDRVAGILVAGFVLLSAAIPLNVAAQTDRAEDGPVTDPVLLSLAAGYKATFTCSSYFNAGRTIEQIAGDELHRIYPGYRKALSQLPDAVIDEKAHTVSVQFSDDFAPRVAKWRFPFGCTQMPTGWTRDQNQAGLYELSPKEIVRKKVDQKKAWPQGDKIKGRLFTKTKAGRELRDQVERAFDRKTYGNGTETTAVLIIKDGKIIAEKYRHGFDKYTSQRTWSVAKSIGATIIGSAIHDDYISLMDTNLLAQWSSRDDPRRNISLENMLHMASGLDNGPRGNRTDDIYFGGGRVIDHAQTRRLVVTPGTRWFYANNDTMLSIRALREKMNNDDLFANYPFNAVLQKIGMHHTFLETDWNGDFILSSQVYTTARDLGRLGLLYLNDGLWPYDGKNERIFPDWWSDYVAMPASVQPPLRADGSKRYGYGAQFWRFEGFAGLPDDAYAALGNRGQSLTIIPSANLLIIRRGFDDNGGAQFDVAQFAGDVYKRMQEF